MKIMIGKVDELPHVPKNAYEAMKSVLDHPQFSGNANKMSIALSKQICDKIKTEKVQESIHEGFEPAMVVDDLIVKYSEQACNKVNAMFG